jgi:hypothetical protein
MASAVTQPLLDTIEPDDPTPTNAPPRVDNNISAANANVNGGRAREPVVLVPSNRGNSATAMGSQDLESGLYHYLYDYSESRCSC